MARAGSQLDFCRQVHVTSLKQSSIYRTLKISAHRFQSSKSGQFRRSDFSGQGFTGYYDTNQPTTGPLADASSYGAPRITPKMLKEHLDTFVVDQERAKKVLSVAVYNHYQRVQELERRDEEDEQIFSQQSRQLTRHPVEDEFPGQQPTVNYNLYPPPPMTSPARIGTNPILDSHPLTIEKSNVLLIGPSGVGKTLMAKTLARVLEVPFSMSDCTPFTQAGYIGEDVEVCVQRLLVAANYDVTRAERGIICLDEVDKIATAKVSHGKDVSGEGVQQALLKIIEGTTVQVQAKQEKGSSTNQSRGHNATPPTAYPPNNPSSGGTVNSPHPNKGEIYNVNTDNILFICTGAFIGLHKTVMDRIAKGSIGFGASVRRAAASSSDASDPTIRGTDDELFQKHLPFYSAPLSAPAHSLPSSTTSSPYCTSPSQEITYNSLDLVEPADLQKFGLIPELVGRIPITCALSALSEEALVRVLTEPRNSLLQQYSQLFQLSGVELRFTSGALREVARSASGMGTGARGLRTVMERLLGDTMFEAPGSQIRHVLITESVAQRKVAPVYLVRGQQARFHAMIAMEEEEWERRWNPNGGAGVAEPASEQEVSTFEQYRETFKVAGTG